MGRRRYLKPDDDEVPEAKHAELARAQATERLAGRQGGRVDKVEEKLHRQERAEEPERVAERRPSRERR